MKTNYEQLKELVFNGARDKKLEITDRALDQLNHELSVIENQGFVDYFLLFSRVIQVCNELKLLRTYGRGSAPSSLVNYCLDITKINPINEDLVFEIFFAPKHKSLAVFDIDLDIPKGYHSIIIEQLKKKYPEYSSYFIAFTPFADYGYDNVHFNKSIYKKHPCGIIITQEKLTDSTFSFNDQEFYLVEDKGNDEFYKYKIDLVELNYLNKIQLLVNQIGVKYHPYNLPLNDEKVFELISIGDLDNILLLENSSLIPFLNQFKINSINDIAIVKAMSLTGISDYFDYVIENKFCSEEVLYSSDIRVSNLLKETYGLMIYQETFLQLSKVIAGISFKEAGLWKYKIMRSKTNVELMEFGDVFVDGCLTHSSLNEADIDLLKNMVLTMLRLTFQKSHSLSYSHIAYWGAYYKTHFRKQFDKVFKNEIIF
jgi:DNA polymerase-3 subunit alpha